MSVGHMQAFFLLSHIVVWRVKCGKKADIWNSEYGQMISNISVSEGAHFYMKLKKHANLKKLQRANDFERLLSQH